ncbi:uncharacterized protein LOC135186131 isoform X2 [Pogoniulus pusillus]|uniref:uncharacterized protein LOC135186131 isoform X2 n=1 Tax=Pogoniulus pusillus TaxID=488313 RepID=UPI0030B92D54
MDAFSSKKQCGSKAAEMEFSKIPHFSASVSVEGASKATKQGLPKSVKKVEPPSKMTATRALPKRSNLQVGLQMKNQMLETENQQLQFELTEARGTIKELEEEKGLLMQEIEKLRKSQETCMVILARRVIDPDSKILEEEEKIQECQQHTQSLTQKLLEELKQFNQAAAEEREALQACMAKWQAATAKMQRETMEKRASVQVQMKNCTAILDEMEQLLDM